MRRSPIFFTWGGRVYEGMVEEREFRKAIVEMIAKAETSLPPDVVAALRRCLRAEDSPIGRLQLKLMLENLRLAKRRMAPICQDTGSFTFFVRGWLRLHFDIEASIGQAVEEAVAKVPLRKNVVDPLGRRPISMNAGKGQPAVHLLGAGDEEIEVELLVKGGGTENYTKLFMLRPGGGRREMIQAVVSTLSEAGGRVCPPVIVGIGIGGNPENAILLSKLALLRPVGERSEDEEIAGLELEIEKAANELGIGPMGLGGKCTVLGVHVEKGPCHTATLPLGISFQCWVARRARLRGKGMEVEF